MISLPPTSPTKQTSCFKDRLHVHAARLPTRYWLCGALGTVLGFLLVTIATGASGETHKELWAKAEKVSTSLRAKTLGIPFPKEYIHDASYFIENGVSPASWSHTYNPPTCVHEYVTRKGILSSPRPLDEWKQSFASESGCPSYPIPQGGLLFHMHWEGPWLSELEFAIDSFLATQRLEAGHKLIFWHARDLPPPDEVVGRYYDMAPDNMEFRILDRLEESEGTCLMQMPDWIDEETRKAKNMKHPSLSNLTRLLLLTKYGGVWVDSDVAFVRDVTDLLRAGPMAPAYYPEDSQRGTDSPHFYNNHIYVAGPHPSPVANRMLETACSLSYGLDNWPEQYTFKPHMGRVFNDGLLQLCERVTHCGLSAFPLSLVESETWTRPPLLKPCDSGTTEAEVDTVLQRVWSWHFRHECARDFPDETTAYAIVRKRLDIALAANLQHGKGQTLPGAE